MAETTSNSTVVTINTTTAATNLQKPLTLSDTEKKMDASANILLKDFIEFYDKLNEDFNDDKTKKTLIITVGAVQHDSPNNQLIMLLEMLIKDRKVRKNDLVFLHFDSQWHTNKGGLSNISHVRSYQVRNNEKLTASEAETYRLIDNFFSILQTPTESYPEKININEKKKNFMKDYIYESGYGHLHFFIPYDLVTHYLNECDPYDQRKFAISKKIFTEYGKTCPPVPGSTYDTLQKFIQKEKFQQIFIHNNAYWRISGVEEYNKNGKALGIRSYTQNRYFEGMCELLNIVLNAGDSVEKYIFDTEFQRILRGNVYNHKNAKDIKSLKYPFAKIGKLYPLNESTSFSGGKRKTRKQKKKALI